jgi:uncharacterized protein YybS (DUF2232 family)
MSRWAIKTRLDESNDPAALGSPASGKIPGWIRIVPFFLSALFFLSAFFSIFAPLPLIFARYRQGSRGAVLAAVTNSILVAVASGGLSLAVYFIFIVTIGLLMPEVIDRLKTRASLGRIAALTLLGMALTGAVTVVVYSHVQGAHPLHEFRNQVSAGVEFLTESLPPEATLPTEEEREEWKRQVLLEFPSVVAVFSLLLIWANLVILFRANPEGVREKSGLTVGFAREWRAPEALLWLTITSGGLLVVNLYYPIGPVRHVATNVFRVMMSIYAIQGLSILAYFFDHWNVRGFLRILGMLAAVFLVMPLLLSLGFFDQLFDFRGRIRQS